MIQPCCYSIEMALFEARMYVTGRRWHMCAKGPPLCVAHLRTCLTFTFVFCAPHQPVMVDAFLSKQLRAHQREGVQFMYDSIMGVRSPGYEGCILAGKERSRRLTHHGAYSRHV